MLQTSSDCCQISVYAVPEKIDQTAFALDAAVQLLDFYDDYFDIPYPLPKQGQYLLCQRPVCVWDPSSFSDCAHAFGKYVRFSAYFRRQFQKQMPVRCFYVPDVAPRRPGGDP